MLEDGEGPMSPRSLSSISGIAAPFGLLERIVTIASRTSPGRRRCLLFDFVPDCMGRNVRRPDVFVNIISGLLPSKASTKLNQDA